ncbi:hypothetical protein C7U89_18370 [Bradyrhizobium sp. WBOS4]|nr:hypothetical protein [Bradyrhizobium sp. WBOS8]MDD1584890.1 hypothetical protein [Bradyrhizobium sp. WBOS4]UUO50315.1 hypothetical protein DCM78_27410 [Bradyrhizobium sp. WBOS04]UUO59081.1 hypothetical protein DCM80_07690 [Bradyrhizobium sp. WBOS08]
MSSSLLAFVLLDEPAMPDMSAVANVLHARHPDLASEAIGDGPSQQTQANSPLIRCGRELVAVMSMPASVPHDQGLWARAATTWPESKAVAARHRGHVIVSMLGKSEQPLVAARGTTALIGALIATMPEACGVVWAGRVARPADLWLEMSRDAFAAFPDYPFRLWVDILPFRSGARIGAVTVGLSAFVDREIEFVTARLTLSALFDKVAGLAVYLIEHGSVVKDGDTIGASASERIRVRHKESDAFGGMPVFYCVDEVAQ